MMTLLSLPLIIPVLLIAVKLSLVSVGALIDDGSETDYNILIGINLIMLGIGSFLFPYLWRS
jgi:heme exporter protein B